MIGARTTIDVLYRLFFPRVTSRAWFVSQHRRRIVDNLPLDGDLDDPHDNLAQDDGAGTLINSFLRGEQIVDIRGGSTCDF